MAANPIDLVGGLTSNAHVSKGDLTSWVKARVPQVLASPSEVNNTVLASQVSVTLKTTGATYFLDAADTTTADDGVTCLVSSDGKRFKILSAVVTTTGTQTLTNKTFDTANNTFKLNGTAFGTATQATAALNNFAGDVGSGGTKGLVPAPAAGDAAAAKFLKADGSWGTPSTGGSSGLPLGYWAGLQHSNNVTTPNSKIDIGSGVVRDSTGATDISVSSGTLDLSVNGAVNRLDTGSLANNTQYYTFVISQAAGASPGFLASTSPTSPTLPSGYTLFRRIGSFRTNGSAQVLAFRHVNDHWYYETAIRDLNASGTVGTSFSNVTLSVPAVQGVTALFAMTFFHASLTIVVNVMPTFMPSTAAAGFAYNTSSTGGGTFGIRCQVDSAGRVQYKSSQSSSSVVIDTAGWIDPL